jgi:TolB-like protein/Flp pilus assembly protein TadD
VVKILDFGLAKGAATDSGSRPDLAASPTVALGATEAGVILGTAPYMSPEQARGHAVDRRVDVWALGCVLYECLTGRQAFAGDTTSDVLARILEREPDWEALPASVPPRLRDLLRRCLTKSAADRPRDAGDLRGELLAIAADLSSPSRSARSGELVPSVAVLYFENLSPDAESDYFCAGITEDILTDLSKLKGLRVASRNAVARYRGAAVDIPKVSGELGVGAVLEGSVRRAGDRVRITAQLLKSDGFHLWADRYDRKLDDVFAVQDEIAAAIAGALRVALSPAESAAQRQDRPADVRAYDLYLKGREQYRRYSPESLREALRLFEQALEVEPDYALAWAGVGDACGQLVQWSTVQDPEPVLRRGLEAARKAIQLAPRLAEGHKAEALVLGQMGDRPGSVASLRRAVEVDPRYTPGLGNLAVRMFEVGDLAAAERWFRRSLLVEPDVHTMTWVSYILSLTRRPDEARTAIQAARRMSDDRFYVTIVHTHLAFLSLSQDRHDELPAILEEARRENAEPANLAMVEAYLAAREGRAPQARRLLEEHGGSTLLNMGGCSFGARAALLVGDRERAVAFYRRRVNSELAPVIVRLEPGFEALLEAEPLAPRVSPLTLAWPLEAPMLRPEQHRLFREVRIESALPEASEVRRNA